MSDSSAIDGALVTLLNNDSALMAILTDKAHFDVAPEDATRFAIVSLLDSVDEPMYGGRAFEDSLYLVKAVIRQKDAAGVSANLIAAAARIDALLEDQPLTVSGYTWMTMHREARVRYVEVDEIDPSLRWHHRGGHYRVTMSLT